MKLITPLSIILLAMIGIFNTLSIRNVHSHLNETITLINENTKIGDYEDEKFLEKIGMLQRQVDDLNNLEDIHWSNITSNYMEMKYLEGLLGLQEKVDKHVYKIIIPSQKKYMEERTKEKYPNQ